VPLIRTCTPTNIANLYFRSVTELTTSIIFVTEVMEIQTANEQNVLSVVLKGITEYFRHK
jgi:hypothetical protein